MSHTSERKPPTMLLTSFAPNLALAHPDSAALLTTANLVLHPDVERLALTGSRGMGGTPRPDSDLDLSLIVAASALPTDEPAREQVLRAVLETTLTAWRGAVACDLAAIFAVRRCPLPCFAGIVTAPPVCPDESGCRFGIYKLQQGFQGYVAWEGIELQRIYPLLEIWRRPAH